MINAISVLIRTQLVIARNTFWRGKIAGKIGAVVLMLGLCGASYGLYWATRGIVRGLTSPEFAELLNQIARQGNGIPQGFSVDVSTYLLAVPALVLFGALVIMVLTSFTTVLSSLYLSGDMDMLLAAPVPMRAVFVVKFFGGLLVPYLLLFFLLGPFLLGFGQGLGFGAAYFVMAIVVVLLLPLLPTGIGALLTMAVVRVIPARRAREIVGVIGGMVGVAWYIFSQFSRELTPRVGNARMLDYLRRFDTPLAPSAWASRALIAAGKGQWPTLALYGGMFVLLSVGMFAACVLLAERLYYAGWSNMATQGGRVRQRATGEQPTTNSNSGWATLGQHLAFFLPGQSQAVLYKDLKIFPRDLRNLQQLIFPLVLAAIWSFRLVTGGGVQSGPEMPPWAVSLQNFASAGISFYICLVLSGAMGGAGVSREGRGYWLLKTAPISSLRVLLGKLTLAYLPYPTVGVLFTLALAILQRSGLADSLRALLLVLVAGLGVTSITVGMGAAFPKFNWDNPRQQNSFRAGCLAPIVYLIYLALAMMFVIVLPGLAQFAPDLAVLLAIAGWVLFLLLTGAVVWGALSIGAAQLEQIEVG
ncbi:MAG TPA: hypothetical protein PKK78_20030 [Kouleothrix sp.]|nr:hypothetical protein [Kouleothrix sp.]